MSALPGRTTVVVRLAVTWARIAGEFAEAGTPVAAVAQSRPVLAEQAATSASIRIKFADTADATVASEPAGPVRAGGSHPDPYELRVLTGVMSLPPRGGQQCSLHARFVGWAPGTHPRREWHENARFLRELAHTE
jgi:hypothetical protein